MHLLRNHDSSCTALRRWWLPCHKRRVGEFWKNTSKSPVRHIACCAVALRIYAALRRCQYCESERRTS